MPQILFWNIFPTKLISEQTRFIVQSPQSDRLDSKSVIVAFSLPNSQHIIAWNSALLQINLHHLPTGTDLEPLSTVRTHPMAN